MLEFYFDNMFATNGVLLILSVIMMINDPRTNKRKEETKLKKVTEALSEKELRLEELNKELAKYD